MNASKRSHSALSLLDRFLRLREATTSGGVGAFTVPFPQAFVGKRRRKDNMLRRAIPTKVTFPSLEGRRKRIQEITRESGAGREYSASETGRYSNKLDTPSPGSENRNTPDKEFVSLVRDLLKRYKA